MPCAHIETRMESRLDRKMHVASDLNHVRSGVSRQGRGKSNSIGLLPIDLFPVRLAAGLPLHEFLRSDLVFEVIRIERINAPLRCFRLRVHEVHQRIACRSG